MKRVRLLLFLLALACGKGWAQLPNGSIAPDFTTTDINGGSHNLYSLLGEGKTVFMDIFATWCGPCWAYHNSHAMEGIWDAYGPPGSDQAYVLAIEGDNSTNVACIYGPSGCVGGTQGNWTAGVSYPICDDAGVASLYQITYYPTIYCICPFDQKAYVCGQLSTGGLWAYRNSHCLAAPIVLSVADVQNVACIGTPTGAIDLEVSGGASPYTYTWSNGMTTEDISNVPAGNYSCTVTGGGNTATIGPITIGAPSSPMAASIASFTPIGCTVAGTITAGGNGGWGNYSYAWSNAETTQTIEVLAPGTYIVTVTDAGGCSKTAQKTMTAPVNPIAAVAQPQVVTCSQPNIELNGTASSNGPDFSYLWTSSNGGHIVSGGATTTPTVNAAGTYTIRVTNDITGCYSLKSVVVVANVAQPDAEAGPAMAVTCANPTTQLQGTGSIGPNFTYLWTATAGGNIQSGAGGLTPTVTSGGMYILKVTNTDNGCSRNDTTTVAGNNLAPTVAIAAPSTLTCTNTSTALNTTTNASTPAFAWTGPNGWTSTEQNPSVAAEGAYSVVVTNQATGCTNTQSATVSANTAAPGASATGGTVTCATTSVQLGGNADASNVAYAWSGPDNFTSTSQNPTVGTAGAYSLVVTNTDNGCTSTASASVSSNIAAPTASAAAPGTLNCNASQVQLNGTASSQGANFTYAWTASNGGNIVSGENTLTPLVNAGGSYAILVTNTDNGCTNTASAAVVQNPPLAAAMTGPNDVSCFGNADGAANIFPSGGSGSYAYAWSNGATTNTISNLPAGIYSVVVTDGDNCTIAASVTISQPEPLACNASATAQTQNGSLDGTATANPTGGTNDYAYAWSNGGNTQTINDLAPGAYTVTVTDAHGCTQVQTVNVNAFNCALATDISATNVSCAGADNGSASVSLQGATEPVAYAWSNGQTGATATNLAPGDYTVQITDAAGCPAELSVSISQPVQLLANTAASGETAQGANDGTASANPTGGTGAYTYLWSNGATEQSLSGLAPGTYTVVVTDANGCTAEQQALVPAFTCALQSNLSVANVNCAGGSDGQATILMNGGAAPYTYLWSNGQTSATATGLASGNYSVAVLDASGCELTENVQVAEPTALAIDLVSTTNVTCPDDQTGTATIAANGGTGTFSYLWDNGQTEATATGLSAGNHSVQVADGNGCQQSLSVAISANDLEAPTVQLQTATLALEANGSVQVSLAALGAQLNDNCAVATLEISPAQFDCSQLGEQLVTVTIWDAAGNAGAATTQVTVVDNLAPTVLCPASQTVCFYENVVNYPAPSAQDNCSGGQWALAAGLPSGSTFPVGVTTQTYTYTDASGNVGNCSFDVIVDGPTSIAGVAASGCFQDCHGSATVIGASGGQQPYTYQWSNGQTGPTATGLCDNSVGLTVVDALGCKTTQNVAFNVPAPLVVSVVSITSDVNSQQVGGANISVAGGTAPFSYVWTAASGEIVSTSEDLAGVGTGTYTVVVTDANGCVVTNNTIVVPNTVSATEPTWAKGMKLVPNPTPGLVQIRFADQPRADVEIAILDATGRLLVSIVSSGERVVDLDLSHLPSGIYSVRLQMAAEVAMRKLVLNR